MEDVTPLATQVHRRVFSEPTLENGNRLRAALVDFGFGSVAPTPEKLAESGMVFMLAKNCDASTFSLTFRESLFSKPGRDV